MKYINSLFGFFICCLIFTTNSAAIESVSSGGDWDDTLTWVGHAIPGETDVVTIKGTVYITKSHTTQNLTISSGAILQQGGNLGWVTLSVMGNIVNNGTIQNNANGNRLWLDLYGDIVNNGSWAPENTYIASKQTQTISQSEGTEFNGQLFKHDHSGYKDTFPVIAASDLIINASTFDGTGLKDGVHSWGTLDMAGHNLTLNGATNLKRVVLKNVATLTGRDSSTFSSSTVEGAITLAGRITITDANIIFNGDVTVKDTLQNGGTLGWVTPAFNAKLTNNGTIRNNPKGNRLWIDLLGDIVNNGAWAPEYTFIASKQTQRISQSEGTEFTGSLFNHDHGGYKDTFPVIAASDLIINASTFDGTGLKDGVHSWGTLDMAGHNLTLNGATNLKRVMLNNIDTLIGRDSSTVSSITVGGPVRLGGTVTITDANVRLNGQTTVSGTLQNGGSLGWVTLEATGEIVNNGTIRNNPRGNALWIALKKNATNSGVWTNSKNTLNDTINQTISLIGGKTIAAPFILDALWPSGPYQWQKNSADWGGTYRNVTFDSITEVSTGIYQCKHDTELSRTITIKTGANAIIQRKYSTSAMLAAMKPVWDIVASGNLTLRIQSLNASAYSLQLFDLKGRMFLASKGFITPGLHTFDIATVSPGSYLARFESGLVRETRMITITR